MGTKQVSELATVFVECNLLEYPFFIGDPVISFLRNVGIEDRVGYKDKLVNYKGVVVDKDGKAVEGAEFFIDEDHKLPQGQSYITGKNGNFSFKAFDNAKMIVVFEKEGEMIRRCIIVDKENNSNMKIVMDGNR